MKFSDQKMNLTLPSIIPLNRLRKSTKSTPNGCGPIPGKTMFPKSESASSIITVKSAFAKYKTDNALTEWYTPEEIEKNYGMTRVAIRSHVYRNNIPSKKEHGQIFYSKLHFDLSKKTTEDDSSEYYTVQEAMKKYSLTRDSVYGILQFHEIKREKKGRFVRFLKVEFDHIMGAR